MLRKYAKLGCIGNEDTRNNYISLYLINSIARVLILCNNLCLYVCIGMLLEKEPWKKDILICFLYCT